MRKIQKLLCIFSLLSCISISVLHADNYSTDFTGWNNTYDFFGPPYSKDINKDGWFINDGFAHNDYSTLPYTFPGSRSEYVAAWLEDRATSTESSLTTPILSYGIGTISLWSKNFTTGGNTFVIQISTNNVNWATVTNIQVNAEAWTYYEYICNNYNARYVRILKTDDSGAGQLMGIDDVLITRPVAKVNFSNVTTDPAQPIIGTDVHIKSQIEQFGDIENMTVTSFWQIASTGAWNAITMEIDGAPENNNYITSLQIPAQSPLDTLVRYYVMVTFTGTDALSPAYYPASGASAPALLAYRQPVFYTGYTNLYITGSFNTNLTLSSDYLWQGVAKLTGSVTDPVFNYGGINGLGTTEWGDNDPAFTTLPVFGTAETSGTEITLNGNHSGYLFFSFNEANNDYNAQRCEYTDFDNWTANSYGTYTNNEDWIISDCRTTTNSVDDLARAYSGKTCIMDEDSGPQYIISPNMTNGIGGIYFWYRNWETNAASPTELYVQVAVANTGPWTTVETIKSIRTFQYLHFSHVMFDKENHFVRIIRDTNTSARICIDNIAVTALSPGITFAPPIETPASIDILDTVSISLDLTLLANASAPECTLWYRYNTNFPFTPIPMTQTGLTFTTSNSIPRMPVGTVQYYIECSYTGMSSVENATTYHPKTGEQAPLEYSVTDVYIFQDFTGWNNTYDFSGPPYSKDEEKDGWLINDGFAHNDFSTLPYTFPGSHSEYGAAWLEEWSISTSSSLTTPVISDGVGSISFFARNFASGANYFSVQTSVNGTDWTTFQTFTQTDESTWEQYVCEINSTGTTYIRIVKTGETTANLLGLDDILITYPPAMVGITNTITHPGYPMTNDEVNVSCTINSSTPAFRAFNIRAKLWWRAGEDAFTSITMNEESSGYFTTATAIPANPARTKIEYHIESIFDGYAHAPADNHSPSFFPTGTTSSTNAQYYARPQPGANYIVRYYESEYQVLQLTGLESPLNLELQDDNTWQGIFTFQTAVTNPSIFLSGLFQYTGTNYQSTADTWADLYQTRTKVPLFNIMWPGETNALTMAGVQQGQYVFRFDENNMSYILQKCVFQDFDKWYADDVNFTESWSFSDDLPIVTNDFDNWALTSYTPWSLENFLSWDLSSEYADGVTTGAVGWVFNQCRIISQLDNDKACMMRDIVVDSYLRPHRNTSTHGIDTFDFEYRCVDTNFFPSIHWNATNWVNSFVSTTFKATELPINDAGNSFGDCAISVLGNYQDENHYYELRAQQTDLDKFKLILYKKNGSGAPEFLVQSESPIDGRISETRTISLLTTTAGTGRVSLEAYIGNVYNFHYYDANSWTNTANATGINTIDADIEVSNFQSGSCQLQHFDNWTAGGPYTSPITNMSWVVDEATISYFDATHKNIIKLDQPGYIRTPLLPHGIGRIKIEYRGEAINKPFTFLIQSSLTGSNNDNDWTTIDTVAVASSSMNDNWIVYNEEVNIATNNIYLRIRMDNASVNQGWFDGIAIHPSFDASMDSYEETFEDGTADELIDPSDWWSITTNQVATNTVYTRPGYTGDPLSFEIQTSTIDNRFNLEAEISWTTHTTLTNCTQTRYVSESCQIMESGVSKNTESSYVRLKHIAGVGNIVLDNAIFYDWHGKVTVHSNNSWRASDAWITTNGVSSGQCAELSVSRSYSDDFANDMQYIRTDVLTNGVGIVKFSTTSIASAPATFELQYTLDTNALWNTIRAYTATNNTWSTNFAEVNISDDAYIRILHTSVDTTARILVDNIEITGYLPRDESNWFVYNALVTSKQTDKLWTTSRNSLNKSSYLNYGPGVYVDDTPIELNEYDANVQSPKMLQGIGEISFWYRSWNESPDNPPTLRIEAAKTDSSTNWIEITTITNITNTEYKYFNLPYYNLTNNYVRFYAETNTTEDGRICIDDILILEPLGADMIMTNLTTIPAIPLDGDPVHVQIDLAQYLLDINVTNMQLRYLVGTNNWAQWAPGNVINMSQVTNDITKGSFTWQTDTPIPSQPIDTPVQYYIYSEFSGAFAENGGSPKTYRSFSNPTHYAPINLNTQLGGTNNIPYYFVFSCPPGSVWINELNLADSSTFDNEYIELCGPAGADISGWKINLRDENGSLFNTYTIPQGTILPADTNSYGFWVLGDSSVVNSDMTLSVPYNDGDANEHIPLWGAIDLARSMGADEYKINYNVDPPMAQYFIDNNYENISSDFWFWLEEDGAMQWQGTGSEYSDFAWSYTTNSHTPGVINDEQILTSDSPVIIIAITDFQMLSTTIQISYTQSSGNPPAPWYATNLLMADPWLGESPYTGPTESNGTYTITIDIPTNSPAYFYKLTTTP